MTPLTLADLPAFRTELLLSVGMLAGLLGEIVRPRGTRSPAGWLLLAGAGAALAAALWRPAPDLLLWNGAYVVDPLARFFKALFLAAVVLVTLASLREHADEPWAGEYYVGLGCSTLGMTVLASAGELVGLFVGLELTSVSLYVLAALKRDDVRSREAGLKYLLVGAFSTALFLFGVSLLYAVCGSTHLRDLAAAVPVHAGQPLMLFGLVFVIAALGFKVAAAPFHMWAPDVYEGGPTPMVAFASVASKAAGFVVVVRLLLGPLRALQDDWTVLVSVMAAATMVVGSFLALPQTNIKRLLAYSSIAQAGYLLLGFLPGTERGTTALLLYLGVYLFTNLAGFLGVIVVSRATGTEEIADYAGLARRSPLLALSVMLALLSLAGIPPLGGFIGKLYLFAAAMEFPGRFLWLVVLGVLLSIVSLFYYLMIVRQMYIEPPKTDAPIVIGPAIAIALVACVAGILVTGLAPGVILDAAQVVAKSLQ